MREGMITDHLEWIITDGCFWRFAPPPQPKAVQPSLERRITQ